MIRRALCTLTLAVVLSSGQARAEAPLTLDEAVKLAAANNERSHKAPLRVDAAQGQLERARTAFLPSVVASSSGAMKDPADRAGRILSGQGTVSITQPLVNLPAFPLYSQAQHTLESERWGAVDDQRLLAFDTAHAYLLALSGERLAEAAQRRLDRAKAEQADTQARVDAQLASTNDVTRLSIASISSASQVSQAAGSLTRAYLQLAFLVGREVSGPLVTPQRTTNAAQKGTFRMDEIIRLAESRRPDVHSSHERTEALRQFAKEPLYRLAPTLGVSANVHAVIAPEPTDIPRDETALLTLTWTIYDAGARYADRKTRLAQVDSQALDEHLLVRSIATDVNVAIAALHTARDVYKISEDSVTAAKKNTEETEILYRQGLARAIELTDANASEYDAEVNLETANLAMEQAYLQLRQALGLGPTGDELTSGTSGGAR